ncbi:hypothetical protein BCR36DRAFT_407162 [Piromyces finnis]|uniref:Uncharacterized protein n=1 Tax=Piromyces finnis TaxID=1754191 RepID=A0A1Y1UVY4_9FUNG|nr:hypothetical protein BCR36DRAFT_407162 [Piromyces finnis]|eukprot:ORX42147.1 hypothetical protein BCR36DRAFT_407162 [Piromyces finnis]
MCKKTTDNEHVESLNDTNQHFSLDTKTDFSKIFKLIEEKIKSFSPSQGWDLYLCLSKREISTKTEQESKDENKKLKVMDSDIYKSMEKDDKYIILEKYYDIHQEVLNLKELNKCLKEDLQRINNNYQQVEENLRRCDEERIKLSNSNGSLNEIINEKKASISSLNNEIGALKKVIEENNKVLYINVLLKFYFYKVTFFFSNKFCVLYQIKNNFEEIQFQSKKNNELENILFKKENDLERNKIKFNNDFIKKEKFNYHYSLEYPNNNYNNTMIDNNPKYYPNQMPSNGEGPKPQNELANLFMLAEQTLRMENDYSNNDIRMDPMKDGNQPILPREKRDMKNDILMGRRSSINSMAVFTPPTSPIPHSNNIIPNGSVNFSSKMNNYNSSGMNNNSFNSNGRNSMNSNGNTNGNRPRGRPSHKETNNNETTKRHKLIAVNPSMSSSSLFNVSRMLNNGSNNNSSNNNNSNNSNNNNSNNSSQNYMNDNNRNNVLPALNHSHSQENVELPSIPMDVQRNNSMDNYKPLYNSNKDVSMGENQDYPLLSNENDGDHNELTKNNANDNMNMNGGTFHKRKNSYTYQQQSTYTSGKVGSRKISQSGSVPIQPQQNKKQKYYQHLQPQTNTKNSNGKNGSSSPSTPISSPSSTSSSNSHHTLKETKHVSPSAYVRWRTNEDDLLRSLVKKMGPKQWDKIAEEIPGRTYHQCRQHRAAIKNRNPNSIQHHNSSPVLLAPSTSRYNNTTKHASLDESELSYNNNGNIERDMDYPSKSHSLNPLNSKDKVMNGPSNDFPSNNEYSKNLNMNQEYNNNGNHRHGNSTTDSMAYPNDFRFSPIQPNKKSLDNNKLNPRLPLTNSPSLAPINPNNQFESNELPGFNFLTNEKNISINNNSNNNNNSNINSSYLNPINTNNKKDSNSNTNNIISSSNINYSKNININGSNNNSSNDRSSLNDLLLNQENEYNSISTSNSNLKKNDTPVVMDEITTTLSQGKASNYYSIDNDANLKNNNEQQGGMPNKNTADKIDDHENEIEEIMVEGAVSTPRIDDSSEKNRKILNSITQSPKSQKSEEEEEEEGEMDVLENYNSRPINNEKENKNKVDAYNTGMKRKREYPINNTLNKKIHSTIEQNNIDMPLTPQSISEGSSSISMNDGTFVKKNDSSSSALVSPSPSTTTESLSGNGKQINRVTENTTGIKAKEISTELENGREKSDITIEDDKSTTTTTTNPLNKSSLIALN